MSRIGEKPIDIPSGVTLTVDGSLVVVSGSKGELRREVPSCLSAAVEGNEARVARCDDTKTSRSLHGLFRSLIANMVEGVDKGFRKDLEIQGVGFRAAAEGQKVVMTLGFASPVEYTVPDGVTVVSTKGTDVVVTGADKQQVGDVAARIWSFFPAEPYKGKGIRYKGEHVRRKVGKTVA